MRIIDILTVIALVSFQSYDKFIEKTKAELNKKSDTVNLQMQESNSFGDESSVKAPAQRYVHRCKEMAAKHMQKYSLYLNLYSFEFLCHA